MWLGLQSEAGLAPAPRSLGPPWLPDSGTPCRAQHSCPSQSPPHCLLSKGSLRLGFKARQVAGSAWKAVPAQTKLWGPSLVAPFTGNDTAPHPSCHSTLPLSSPLSQVMRIRGWRGPDGDSTQSE